MPNEQIIRQRAKVASIIIWHGEIERREPSNQSARSGIAIPINGNKANSLKSTNSFIGVVFEF